MKLIKGLLNYAIPPVDEDNIYLFTANAFVRKDGALVMGRGAAKQVRDLYPQVQYELGSHIKRLDKSSGRYLISVSHSAGFPIYAFQVKYNFSDDADLELIRSSTELLGQTARTNPGKKFHINYPGVGNGKLAIELVKPLLENLPDNVFLYL